MRTSAGTLRSQLAFEIALQEISARQTAVYHVLQLVTAGLFILFATNGAGLLIQEALNTLSTVLHSNTVTEDVSVNILYDSSGGEAFFSSLSMLWARPVFVDVNKDDGAETPPPPPRVYALRVFSSRLELQVGFLLLLLRVVRRTLLREAASGPAAVRMQKLNAAILTPTLGLAYDVHSGRVLITRPQPSSPMRSSATGAESTGV
jgi:hypothetical protein